MSTVVCCTIASIKSRGCTSPDLLPGSYSYPEVPPGCRWCERHRRLLQSPLPQQLEAGGCLRLTGVGLQDPLEGRSNVFDRHVHELSRVAKLEKVQDLRGFVPVPRA